MTEQIRKLRADGWRFEYRAPWRSVVLQGGPERPEQTMLCIAVVKLNELYDVDELGQQIATLLNADK